MRADAVLAPGHAAPTAPRWQAGAGWRVLLACAAFVAALAVRTPHLLSSPRFWGEEGAYYYAVLQGAGWLDWLTLVVRGNHQLALNLSTGLATLVPAQHAPAVTMLLALAVALVLVALLARLSHEQGWSMPSLVAAVVALAWLPLGYEVWLTSTNLQWICGGSMVVLALTRADQWTRRWQLAASAWVALCAFSGIPSACLVPLFAAAAWQRRSRVHLAWAVLLAIGALVQLAVMAVHPQGPRNFGLDPSAGIPFVAQTLLAPVLGVPFVDRYLALLRLEPSPPMVLALLAAGLVPALACVGVQVRAGGQARAFALTLVAVAVLTAALNLFGALGGLSSVMSAWMGGRYFFVATLCWLMLLMATAAQGLGWARVLAMALLAAVVLGGLVQTRTGEWRRVLIEGPSWAAQVAQCAERRPCTVHGWPMGWSFELTRP